ncbi:MAG: MCE family protein [Akkermansiaceae bacterium]|nr:MCE family protein [Akkermansiaceae bacterium]
MTFNAFVRKEYSHLVKENSRFWNISGIDISAGADGFKFRSSSLQALISGGATFGVPEGATPGNIATDGRTFMLYSNQDDANQSTFTPTMKLVLLFDQSIRGLVKGAPVEFRGIPIGRVAEIPFNYASTIDDRRIATLIEIDPSLLHRNESAKEKSDIDCLKDAVKRGLRASLKTGNLLTGSLFVDLDDVKDASLAPAEMAQVGDFPSIPTVSSGLVQLEAKLNSILTKVDALDLEGTMAKVGPLVDEFKLAATDSREMMAEIGDASASARKMIESLNSPEFAKLPTDLRKTLTALENLSPASAQTARSKEIYSARWMSYAARCGH